MVTEIVVNTSKMLEQTPLHGEALITFPNWMLELSESPRKHRDLGRCRSQLCQEASFCNEWWSMQSHDWFKS